MTYIYDAEELRLYIYIYICILCTTVVERSRPSQGCADNAVVCVAHSYGLAALAVTRGHYYVHIGALDIQVSL